jgi:hypothetical protein
VLLLEDCSSLAVQAQDHGASLLLMFAANNLALSLGLNTSMGVRAPVAGVWLSSRHSTYEQQPCVSTAVALRMLAL